MDLRTSKTEKNIRNAFIELRSKKPIEKISVKELTELACVNKSTFYRHYTDVYALSESIEDDLVESCMEMIAEPDRLLEKEGILSLINALDAQSNIFNIIFSGSRKDAAIHKIHYRFMKKLLAQHPEYQDDTEKKVMLTTLTYGMVQSYRIYSDLGVSRDTILNSLVKLNQSLSDGGRISKS